MKKHISKIILVLSIVFIIIITFCKCSFGDALPINTVVHGILEEKQVKKSKIIHLYEDESIVDLYEYKDPVITNEELQEYIDTLLVSHEEMIEISNRNIVQSGDAIIVDYIVYYKDEIVASAENDSLLVGSGKYSVDFENAVIGASVNIPFNCIINSPVDTEKYKKGDSLRYNITVKSINYFKSYAADSQYIWDYYNVKDEEEFREYCKYRLISAKRKEATDKADKNFLSKVAGECKFYFDEDEVAQYSKRVVENYSNAAYLNGVTLDKYIEQVLKISEDEFYNRCYEEGKSEIAEYLIIGANAYNKKFADEEFAVFCSLYGYDKNNENNINVRYFFLKTKMLNQMKQVVSVGYPMTIELDKSKPYHYEMIDCSETKDISAEGIKKFNVDDVQRELASLFGNIVFESHSYVNTTPIYDTVLSYDCYVMGEKRSDKIAIDTKNGIATLYSNWKDDEYRQCYYLSLTNEQLDFIDSIKFAR